MKTILTNGSEWTRATLGQLSGERGKSIEPAKTPEKEFELYSVPSFPDKRPETVLGKEVGSNKQLVEPRSVLLCKINPRINRVWVVGNFTRHTKIASTEWIIFRAGDEVMSDFLCYFLQQNAVRDFLAHNASGVGGSLMRVKPSTIRDFPFEYPKPKEQRRIVAEIEKQFTRLQAGMAALRRVQANLKRYRAAVLKAACEGRLVPTEAALARSRRSTMTSQPAYETGEALLARILTERRQNWQGRGQYKEPATPDAADLPQIPDGWTWARAEQLCGFITKGTTPSAENMQSGLGEIPFIKVYNLTFTGALNSDYKPVFISRETHEGALARSKVRSGDILINIVGPPLGQVSIVPATIVEANINQAIARFRVVLPDCRKLLGIWLMAEPIMAWAMKRAKTTAGQSNLTLELCRDLPIPLPPLPEQTRIVAEVERRLSVVEELESVVSANLQRATRLRQSILHEAFRGLI